MQHNQRAGPLRLSRPRYHPIFARTDVATRTGTGRPAFEQTARPSHHIRTASPGDTSRLQYRSAGTHRTRGRGRTNLVAMSRRTVKTAVKRIAELAASAARAGTVARAAAPWSS